MYTKIVPDTKQTIGTSEILSKDLETKLNLKGYRDQQESPSSSQLSDEGYCHGQSPCSSDCDEDSCKMKKCVRTKQKMKTVSSNDIGLGLEDEAIEPPINFNQRRRSTLTVTDLPLRPALLPLAEPNNLPDSPTMEVRITLQTQISVPSRVLLEERVVEIPEDRFGSSFSSSRRESAQSCISDFQSSEFSGVRFVRTPSVVVSDYSDDLMCGLTQEEIEYFRAQRFQRRFSMDTSNTQKDDGTDDVGGASSSCSNLYYCSSAIGTLDGAKAYKNAIPQPADRKISESSTFEI